MLTLRRVGVSSQSAYYLQIMAHQLELRKVKDMAFDDRTDTVKA